MDGSLKLVIGYYVICAVGLLTMVAWWTVRLYGIIVGT